MFFILSYLFLTKYFLLYNKKDKFNKIKTYINTIY